MFVGVESWGWVLELVLLEVLSEVEVVGVGWVFVGFGWTDHMVPMRECKNAWPILEEWVRDALCVGGGGRE